MPNNIIIDTHSHLFLKNYKDDLNKVLERAKENSVKAIINVGLDVESSKTVISLAKQYKEFYATVGWHPNETKNYNISDLIALEKLAKEEKVCGFGEIGLDFYRTSTEIKTQIKAFEELLNLGLALDLPIVIHSREAFNKTYEILKSRKTDFYKSGVIHCYTGNWAEAKKYLDLGFYLSFPGVITYNKVEDLKEVAKKAPQDKILIETDAPFLTPSPYRGKRNEPSYLIYHLQTLAALRNISFSEMCQITTANALKLFNLNLA